MPIKLGQTELPVFKVSLSRFQATKSAGNSKVVTRNNKVGKNMGSY